MEDADEISSASLWRKDNYVCKTLCGKAGRFMGKRDGNSGDSSFNNPTYICGLVDGSFIVSDTLNNCLRRIDTNGRVSTVVIENSKANSTFLQPKGLCSLDVLGDPSSFLVCDYGHNRIRKIDFDSSKKQFMLSNFAGNGKKGSTDGNAQTSQFDGPTSLLAHVDGSILVADKNNHKIRRIHNNIVTTIAGSFNGNQDGPSRDAKFNRPTSLALFTDKSIFVADKKNHTIRRISPDLSVVTTVCGNGSPGYVNGINSVAKFNNPTDIKVASDSSILVADRDNNSIRLVYPTGTNRSGSLQYNVTTWIGKKRAGFKNGSLEESELNLPTSLFIDHGRVVIVDSGNHCIRAVNSYEQEEKEIKDEETFRNSKYPNDRRKSSGDNISENNTELASERSTYSKKFANKQSTNTKGRGRGRGESLSKIPSFSKNNSLRVQIPEDTFDHKSNQKSLFTKSDFDDVDFSEPSTTNEGYNQPLDIEQEQNDVYFLVKMPVELLKMDVWTSTWTVICPGTVEISYKQNTELLDHVLTVTNRNTRMVEITTNLSPDLKSTSKKSKNTWPFQLHKKDYGLRFNSDGELNCFNTMFQNVVSSYSPAEESSKQANSVETSDFPANVTNQKTEQGIDQWKGSSFFSTILQEFEVTLQRMLEESNSDGFEQTIKRMRTIFSLKLLGWKDPNIQDVGMNEDQLFEQRINELLPSLIDLQQDLCSELDSLQDYYMVLRRAMSVYPDSVFVEWNVQNRTKEDEEEGDNAPSWNNTFFCSSNQLRLNFSLMDQGVFWLYQDLSVACTINGQKANVQQLQYVDFKQAVTFSVDLDPNAAEIRESEFEGLNQYSYKIDIFVEREGKSWKLSKVIEVNCIQTSEGDERLREYIENIEEHREQWSETFNPLVKFSERAILNLDKLTS